MELNTIVCGDCLDVMADMQSQCVDLAVTSPPFNIGFDYGVYKDRLSWPEYYYWIAKVLKALFRITRPGGVLAWNIPMEIRRPKSNPKLNRRIEPFFVKTHELCLDAGYLYRQSVVWVKGSEGNAIGNSSFRGSDSDPFLRDCFEMIWLGSKERYYHDGGTGQMGYTAVPLDESTKNVWWLPNSRSGRLPTFPLKLVSRLIERFMHRKGGIAFDPFMGSGTTAIAALKLGRHFYGCDINQSYVDLANKRIEKTKLEMAQMKMFDDPIEPHRI